MASDRSLSLPLGAYGAAHAIGLVAPLVTVPWLARALGPEAWGPVLVAQGLAGLLQLLIEYGFDLTATRDVARLRGEGDGSALGTLVSGVMGARALLVPVAALLTVAAIPLVPALAAHPRLAWQAWGLAVARGLSPLWFFQGEERPLQAVAVDAGTKLLAALAVVPLVREPEDAAVAIALPALAAALTTGWLLERMYLDLRRRGIRPPISFAAAGAQLRAAREVFLFRGASTLYQHANLLLVSALADPAAVAAYGGADRLVRAAVNTLQPLTLTFFPRNSRIGTPESATTWRATVRWIIGAGAAWSVILLAGAPWIIRLLMGPGYDFATLTLRLLAPLPLLIAIGTVLGIHWAIPAGRERAFRRIVLLAGAANLAVGAFLVPHWGPYGMTTAVVLAESIVTFALYRLWRRAR